MLRHSAKTIQCLQRAKQGNAQACTALLVPPRGHLPQLSAGLQAHLLPEIVQLPGEMQKPMLDDVIVRQEALLDYQWMRQLPGERLIDLHRRNLHSQRLKDEREQTRIRHSYSESPPDRLTQKRISALHSSNPNCQRNTAVDLYVQPLFCGRAWVVSSASKLGTIGHCGKKLALFEKNASALNKEMCLDLGNLIFAE